MSHDWILEQLTEEVYNSRDYQKAPATTKTYLQGWQDCKRDWNYFHELEWRLWHVPSGRLVTDEEMKANDWKYQDIDPNRCKHVWKHLPDRVF
jgi:hypothetical protein